jgi:5-methylcytosine-specific restriction enzyme A
MAVTKGQGNPNWTKDEIILALDLYFDFEGKIPSGNHPQIIAMSKLLRAFPYHSQAARQESFRNPDGVGFKLQNLRQLATGKGLGNVSKMDGEVWEEFGGEPHRTKTYANLIRAGIEVVESENHVSDEDEVFVEGKVVTETHKRRERNPNIRKKLLAKLTETDSVKCSICDLVATHPIREAVFEAHHIIPLSESTGKPTMLKDMALLCANCHKMVHKAIAIEKRWLTLDEAKSLFPKE